jgi:uncharacterized protein (TIGR00255 family)
MSLSSMTGFSRVEGLSGAYAWAWELKSVNGKGFEFRVRIPAGWDGLEIPARARANAALARGTVYGTLTLRREGAGPVVKVNEPVLAAVLATIRNLSQQLDAAPPRLDGILNINGVIELADADEDEEVRRLAEAAIVEGFGRALAGLLAMRRREGEALGRVLAARLSEIDALLQRAEAAPGRSPDAIKARLSEQIALLLDVDRRFDADRLHQEAILIAAKSDIREELDRLAAHVGQARHLLEQGGAVGRRLDFLSQELHRETNTVCAKSNDIELTTIGLELKTVIEQFREQVQNLE